MRYRLKDKIFVFASVLTISSLVAPHAARSHKAVLIFCDCDIPKPVSAKDNLELAYGFLRDDFRVTEEDHPYFENQSPIGLEADDITVLYYDQVTDDPPEYDHKPIEVSSCERSDVKAAFENLEMEPWETLLIMALTHGSDLGDGRLLLEYGEAISGDFINWIDSINGTPALTYMFISACSNGPLVQQMAESEEVSPFVGMTVSNEKYVPIHVGQSFLIDFVEANIGKETDNAYFYSDAERIFHEIKTDPTVLPPSTYAISESISSARLCNKSEIEGDLTGLFPGTAPVRTIGDCQIEIDGPIWDVFSPLMGNSWTIKAERQVVLKPGFAYVPNNNDVLRIKGD